MYYHKVLCVDLDRVDKPKHKEAFRNDYGALLEDETASSCLCYVPNLNSFAMRSYCYNNSLNFCFDGDSVFVRIDNNWQKRPRHNPTAVKKKFQLR